MDGKASARTQISIVSAVLVSRLASSGTRALSPLPIAIAWPLRPFGNVTPDVVPWFPYDDSSKGCCPWSSAREYWRPPVPGSVNAGARSPTPIARGLIRPTPSPRP